MSIIVNDLCYSYKKGTPFEKKVLHNIYLQINDGEFVGVIGPTQSGKTTLAQHFNALLLPQTGKVTVNNCDTADKKADLVRLRHNIGYVFQNPDYQLFAPTVGEDISFGPKNQKLGAAEIDSIVREVMTQVGLNFETFYKRDIFALSGGQKRRVAIAGVLACRPKILILDDITAGLDPQGREEILAVVKMLHQEQQITIIFISNSMDEVAELAERIIVLDSGMIALDGDTRSVFSQSRQLQEIGLELPEVMNIAEKLRQCGYKLPVALLNPTEALASIAAALQEGRVK
ncbi:MAG: energy-coupling factor transporter ATPase [Dethiobacteria bacterium]|nr:energy-coupling factor transporter ATPase [Dethiobacteria bacterium]